MRDIKTKIYEPINKPSKVIILGINMQMLYENNTLD